MVAIVWESSLESQLVCTARRQITLTGTTAMIARSAQTQRSQSALSGEDKILPVPVAAFRGVEREKGVENDEERKFGR